MTLIKIRLNWALNLIATIMINIIINKSDKKSVTLLLTKDLIFATSLFNLANTLPEYS